MLRLGLVLGALLAAPALAAVGSTDVVGPFDLYRGAKKISTFPTYATCHSGALAQAPVGKYACKNAVAITTKTIPDAPPPPDMHGGMHVDATTLPASRTGAKTDLLTATGRLPPPADSGAFRTVCSLARASFDDPIVYPGAPGKSHLHLFFGNDGTDAFSTLATLRAGGSTCRGGTVNQTAYWEPAVVDSRTAAAVAPQSAIVYYKNGFKIAGPFSAIPEGLKMVAGNPLATGPGDGAALFTCIDSVTASGPHSQAIPACAAGNTLWAAVEFPQCWNGKDLDAPDHRAHMSYPVQLQQAPFTWACPATHPVAVPVITINVVYPVRAGDDTTKWRLASDAYDPALPGGYSLHADWFNAWKPEVMAAWIAGCNNAGKDCGATMLGDGREMDEFDGN